MGNIKVKDSWYRGAIVVLDKRAGWWYLIDRSSRVVLDHGRICRTGWSFYLGEGRN